MHYESKRGKKNPKGKAKEISHEGAGTVVQGIRLPLEMPASNIRVPRVLLLTQLSPDVPGKVEEDGPTTWVSVSIVEYSSWHLAPGLGLAPESIAIGG